MMIFTHAITRRPGENFAQGITTSDLGMPDYQRMLAQHGAYIDTLKSLGLEVLVLDALEEYPDAYFVEDTAVVIPEVAIITNPGAAARKGEQQSIEPLLSRYRQIARIQPPGTVDGGDVLLVDKHIFVGISERTNREGAEQFGDILTEYGYTWGPIAVAAGLHLKSSVNHLGGKHLLVTREFVSLEHLQMYDKIVLDEAEEYAANTLWVNDTLITPKGFPKTKKQLESLGLPIIELDVSEARKMDGGLTCMSLRF
ncbi:MAG: hypothetical protein KAI94_04925 [Anaerolineales bacterium]|nr:hypothetical protein [Anaerolineales bacterium]